MNHIASRTSLCLWILLAGVLFANTQQSIESEYPEDGGALAWIQSFLGMSEADDCDCTSHATTEVEQSPSEEGDCPCPPGCSDCFCCPTASAACLSTLLPSLEYLGKTHKAQTPPATPQTGALYRVWRPPTSRSVS